MSFYVLGNAVVRASYIVLYMRAYSMFEILQQS